MRTFKGTLSLNFRVVVADQFLQDMREAAEQEDASVFLKKMHADHPVNDDAFISAVLSNGIRAGVQHDLARRFDTSVGLGGTVSPATITITESIPDHDAPAAVPQVIEVAKHPHLNTEGQG